MKRTIACGLTGALTALTGYPILTPEGFNQKNFVILLIALLLVMVIMSNKKSNQ